MRRLQAISAFSRKLVAFLSALAIIQPLGAAAQDAHDFDLSSGARQNFSGGADGQAMVNVGGVHQNLSSSDALTAAEYAALQQVLTTGRQTLQVNAAGAASAGSLALGAVAMNNLVIPTGVTAVHNFGANSVMSVLGNLVNFGTLYAASTDPSTRAANITAGSVLNSSGATLATAAFGTRVAGVTNVASRMDLNIDALDYIINQGTLRSSSSMTLVSRSGDIRNSGLIQAQAGDLNIASAPGTNLVVNNIDGVLSAVSGVVNLGSANDPSKHHTLLWGGDVKGKELNVVSGNGVVNIATQSISGQVNIDAGEAHVLVTDGDLKLGAMNLSGDPTFYNTSGDVIINSPIATNGAPLAIVASGNILTAPGATIIDTSAATGNGGEINLIAGANITSPATGAALPPTPDLATPIVFEGGSATGGRIDLATGTAVTAISSNSTDGLSSAGDINIVAFTGSAANSGSIFLGSTDVTASGETAGTIKIVTTGGAGRQVVLKNVEALGNNGGEVSITAGALDPGSIEITNGAITNGSLNVVGEAMAAVTTVNGGRVRAPLLELAGNPTVGTFTSTFDVEVGTLDVSTGALSNVNVKNFEPGMGLFASVGGSLSLFATDDLTLLGAVNAGTVQLISTGDMFLNENINATAVGLQAGAAVQQPGAAVITATTISVSAGTDIGAALNPLDVEGSSLSLNAAGDAFFSDASDLILTNSSVGALLEGDAAGVITVQGNVSAVTVDLNANEFVLMGNIGRSDVAASVTLDAAASIFGNPTARILSATVTLTSATQGISNVALANTSSLTVSAQDSISLSSNGAVVVASATSANPGSSSFSLSTAGALTTQGDLDFNVVQLVSTSSSAGITVNGNVGRPGAVVYMATWGSGSISQAATKTIEGTSVELISGSGNVGTLGTELSVNAESLFVSTNVQGLSSGNVFIESTSGAPMTVSGSAGAEFSVLHNAALSIGNVYTWNGAITLRTSSGSVGVLPDSTINATGGNISISTGDIAGGAITIGQNARILASRSGSAQIAIFLGGSPGAAAGTLPANVTLGGANPGVITFGANSIEASAPTNFINYSGSILGLVGVRFDTQGQPANRISLGGGVIIDARTTPHLKSLDLSNPAAVGEIVGNTLITESLVVENGVAVGGTLTLQPQDIAGALTAFNIPSGVTVEFQNFKDGDRVRVFIDQASTSKQAVIGGLADFTGTNPVATIDVVSNQTGVALNVLSTGRLESDGVINLSAAGGGATLGGVVRPTDTGSASDLHIIVVKGFTQSSANLTISNTIGAPNVGILLELFGGSVLQTAGLIQGNTLTISTVGNVGTVAQPLRTSVNQVTLGMLTDGAQAIITNTSPIASTVLEVSANGPAAIQITNNTGIHLPNSMSIKSLTLKAGNNSDITQSDIHSIQASFVSLTASGTGSIFVDGMIDTPELLMRTASGDIGSVLEPTLTSASMITAFSTGGSVYAAGTSPALTLSNSGAAGTFQFDALSFGGLTIQGPLSASDVDVSSIGSMLLEGQVGKTGAFVDLQTIAGPISQQAGSKPILAGSLLLSAPIILPLVVSVQTLNVSSTGPATISNVGKTGVILNNSTVSGPFTFTSTSNITFSGNSTLTLLSVNAGSKTVTISGNLNVNGPGNWTAGAINTQLGLILSGAPQTFNVKGDIGSPIMPLELSAPVVNATAGGNIFLQTDSGVVMNVASAGKILSVNSLGMIIASTVSAKDVRFTTSNDGIIVLQSSAGSSDTVWNLNANGSGIVVSSGLLTGKSFTAQSGSGVIDLDITGGTISATSSGPVILNSSGNMSAKALSGQVVVVDAEGNFSSSAAITGSSVVNISAKNIELGGNVQAPFVALETPTGTIKQKGNVVVTATNLSLTAASVSTTTAPFRVDAGSLSLNATKDAFIHNVGSGGISTAGLTVTGKLSISSVSPISLASSTEATTVSLVTTANNANIVVDGVVNATQSVTITAHGTGSIVRNLGAALLTAPTIALKSSSGNIGKPNSPIHVSANVVSANTGGNGSAAVHAVSSVRVGASSAGQLFQLTANGAITSDKAASKIVANEVLLQSLQGNGSITLLADVGKVGGTSRVVAHGTGGISSTAVIRGATVILESDGGNIGASSKALKTAASSLRVFTGGFGLVNIDNAGAVTLQDSAAGASFQLVGSAGINLNSLTTNAGSINITSKSGVLAVGANRIVSAVNGNVSLQAATTGSISIGAGAIVQATSTGAGTGNVYIGLGATPKTPVGGAAPANVVANASGGGQIFYGVNSIQAAAPDNFVFALGRSVIFNTGAKPASAISLGGSTTINAIGVGHTELESEDAQEMIVTTDVDD